MSNVQAVPEGLPVPEDDGACDHLPGLDLPPVPLTRLHLPFALVRRVTLIVEDGKIRKVFYPVFPPGRNAEEVIRWLSRRSAS